MWKEIFRFELWLQSRRPLFVVSMLAFFGLGLLLASSDAATGAGVAPGAALRNAPIVILHLMPVVSLLGLFVISPFVASAALRDFEHRCDMFFFTRPIRAAELWLGRFAGSMALALLVFLMAVLGLWAGTLAPWQAVERLGPVTPGPYVFGLLVLVVPNLLFMGALLFALAIWSRRLKVVYLCVVFFIGLQDLMEVVAQRMENRLLGSLLEPSGIVALETVSRYWTAAEQSTRLPPLSGELLLNRLLWLGLAAVVLTLAVSRATAHGGVPRVGGRSWSFVRRFGSRPPIPGSRELPERELPDLGAVERDFGGWTRLRQILHQARLELSEILPRTPFLALLAFGLLLIGVVSVLIGSQDGTLSFPLTHLMLEAIRLGSRATLGILLVFYAGELVFSQRSLGMAEVYDALPIPSGVFLGAKLLALATVSAVFLGAAAGLTILVQLARGFDRLEPALYLEGLLYLFLPSLLTIVLAVFAQVLTNHKFFGFLLTAVVLLSSLVFPRLGFENNLYLYGGLPALTYSELNGYGAQVEPFLWFLLYWGFGGALLAVGALVLWPRGNNSSARNRFGIVRRRARPWLGFGLAMALGMICSGGWIFYNTSVEGEYLDRNTMVRKLAEYEMEYGQYRDLPLPIVTSVDTEIDLYPDQRRVEIRGTYRLENRGTETIRRLPVTRSPRWVEGVLPVYGGVSIEAFELPEHRVMVRDDRLGFYLFDLERPIPPGEGFELGFVVRVDHGPFANRRHNFLVVENGTFFSDRSFLPILGYAANNQLVDPVQRDKHQLPPVRRAPDLDDPAATQRNYLWGDWVQLETVISTLEDQVAIAPGNLEGEWLEAGRRFFHYKTRTPIPQLLPFLSGRYEVARDHWRGIEIEVYFHPGHDWNIERFFEVTRASLDYFVDELGPYPHDQLRIVEIPRYHGEVAFSLPQTIAFSEAWSFTADLETGELDWLTAILAHEVSHQWWNHQVVPADAQGSTWIGESLAQYSALMVLEKKHGPEMVQRFLAFHHDRYLAARGRERVREMPLERVENQAYLHYSKGSLAFFSLKERVGEAAVNQALRAFLEEFAHSGPPYATSKDLLRHLRRVVPPEEQVLLYDLFESITLFDNRIVAANCVAEDDGTFRVEVEVAVEKMRDEGLGEMQELLPDDRIDLVLFGSSPDGDGGLGRVLAHETRHLRAHTATFSVVVDEQPLTVALDPFYQHIDRNRRDNVRDLKVETGSEARGLAGD